MRAGIAVIRQAARHQERTHLGIQPRNYTLALRPIAGVGYLVVHQFPAVMNVRQRPQTREIELARVHDSSIVTRVCSRSIQNCIRNPGVARVERWPCSCTCPVVTLCELHAGSPHTHASRICRMRIARLVGFQISPVVTLRFATRRLEHRAHELVGHAHGVFEFWRTPIQTPARETIRRSGTITPLPSSLLPLQ